MIWREGDYADILSEDLYCPVRILELIKDDTCAVLHFIGWPSKYNVVRPLTDLLAPFSRVRRVLVWVKFNDSRTPPVWPCISYCRMPVTNASIERKKDAKEHLMNEYSIFVVPIGNLRWTIQMIDRGLWVNISAFQPFIEKFTENYNLLSNDNRSHEYMTLLDNALQNLNIQQYLVFRSMNWKGSLALQLFDEQLLQDRIWNLGNKNWKDWLIRYGQMDDDNNSIKNQNNKRSHNGEQITDGAITRNQQRNKLSLGNTLDEDNDENSIPITPDESDGTEFDEEQLQRQRKKLRKKLSVNIHQVRWRPPKDSAVLPNSIFPPISVLQHNPQPHPFISPGTQLAIEASNSKHFDCGSNLLWSKYGEINSYQIPN